MTGMNFVLLSFLVLIGGMRALAKGTTCPDLYEQCEPQFRDLKNVGFKDVIPVCDGYTKQTLPCLGKKMSEVAAFNFTYEEKDQSRLSVLRGCLRKTKEWEGKGEGFQRMLTVYKFYIYICQNKADQLPSEDCYKLAFENCVTHLNKTACKKECGDDVPKPLVGNDTLGDQDYKAGSFGDKVPYKTPPPPRGGHKTGKETREEAFGPRNSGATRTVFPWEPASPKLQFLSFPASILLLILA